MIKIDLKWYRMRTYDFTKNYEKLLTRISWLSADANPEYKGRAGPVCIAKTKADTLTKR